MTDDQRDVIGYLASPAAYGAGVERVERVETHASLVFLAGDRAYKLKRAVKYPYLDFSTAALRRRACEAELTLNRRTAPALYLEVRALVRTAEGGIAFSSRGPALDWVLVMRRFDQALLFDALARTGGLGPQVIDALADHVAPVSQRGRTALRSRRRRGDGGPRRDAISLPRGRAACRLCRAARRNDPREVAR